MPNVKELFDELKRYDTFDRRKAGGWRHDEVADLAVTEASAEKSCLVVLNTKLDALKIYGECKSKAPKGTVFHLSTGMCPAHRMSVLKKIKARLKKNQLVICVSTQLIEAGIDIDFASVVRDIAGIDSLVQAAGRCNRHGKRFTGRVHIINLAGGVPSSLKEIRDAQSAGQRVLDEVRDKSNDGATDLSNPELLETYFNYHFHARKVEMSYPVRLEERDDTLLNMLGPNTMAVSSGREDIQVALHQSFMSASKSFEAIEKLTQGVVVPYGAKGQNLISKLCSLTDIVNQRQLLRRAQQYTVNLFASQIQKLPRGAIVETQPGTGVLHLNESFYNDEFGFSAGGGENLEGLVV
jgi:CRISPR-associated endonuclease/helicase Cas3